MISIASSSDLQTVTEKFYRAMKHLARGRGATHAFSIPVWRPCNSLPHHRRDERNYSEANSAKLFHHFVNFGVFRSAEPYVRT